jgi:hypothetical protein
MQKSYDEYKNDLEDEQNLMSQAEWCNDRAETYPQFQFWYLILSAAAVGDDLCESNT